VGVAENDEEGAEHGAGGRGAGTARGAGVAEIGWSAERLFLFAAHAPLTLRSHVHIRYVLFCLWPAFRHAIFYKRINESLW